MIFNITLCNLPLPSGRISVFFVALCETAITQSLPDGKGRLRREAQFTQRPGKIDDTPYHYCFSTH
jgi:hypothetical protein